MSFQSKVTLWLDIPDPKNAKSTLEKRTVSAVEAYQKRFGVLPLVVFMRPNEVPESGTLAGMTVVAFKGLSPHNLALAQKPEDFLQE